MVGCRHVAVLHVADYAGLAIPDSIPEETARRAVSIAKACIQYALALEDEISAPPELAGARRIADWLLKIALESTIPAAEA